MIVHDGSIAAWAGTLLIEDQISTRTMQCGEAPDPAEHARAMGMHRLALERLTEDRAMTLPEVGAKLAVAIDLLRCECREQATTLITSVMVDLRLLELEKAAHTDDA